MERISKEVLERRVARLNRLFQYPDQPYIGTLPQANNFHLDGAYGKYSLCQMATCGSGSGTIIHRCSNAELYARINALIDGAELMQVKIGQALLARKV